MGKLLLRLSKASESLPYLRRYSEIATELGEANSRCKASSALALALDALGMLDKALDELNLVQAISEQAGDLVLQLQACKAMVFSYFFIRLFYFQGFFFLFGNYIISHRVLCIVK